MISEKMKSAILRQLKLQDYDMQDETKANQVPGWDSLNHINVIVAIEKEYGIKLKSFEVLKCKNIGDLQKLVDSKVNA